MTAKELFERYGGQLMRYTYTGNYPAATKGECFRLCGYHEGSNSVAVEREGGSPITDVKFDGFIMLPDILANWKGVKSAPDYWEPIKSGSNAKLCCKCGNYYDKKSEHRKVCK